jgi:hypothetical protein
MGTNMPQGPATSTDGYQQFIGSCYLYHPWKYLFVVYIMVRSLLDNINTKQLKWYGHVQRMEDGRLPKQVIKWSPPGRRK